MNKVPLIKPTLMGKKTIFKTDTIPTKGSNNIVTSDALAQALQDKVVNKEEEGEKTIVPTGDIIIGKLLEDGFYIADPTFLGTKLIKVETPTPGKLYYDRTTHIYYTFQGNISEDNVGIVGYKFEPLVLPSIVKVTWQELKDLRDNSKLIPGLKYHITDYQCTTTQENTKSAGHQFDIVLLALSEDKLAEEGWAMHHIDDTYFANSNLSAWRIWYCLDNDKSRFAWADDRIYVTVYSDNEDYAWANGIKMIRYEDGDGNWEGTGSAYAWLNEDEFGEYFTNNESPQHGDILYYQDGTETGYIVDKLGINGTGVIYRLIDEFNNDIKYDFKNIQFKRTITDGQYDARGDETWCYTLNLWYNGCLDASIVGNIFSDDENMVKGVYNNVIGYTTVYDTWYYTIHSFAFALGNNVILSMGEPHDYFGFYCNKIGDYSFNNTIDGSPYYNTIGNNFVNNIIGYSFERNNIGNNFRENTISGEFTDNTIFNGFSSNTIGFKFIDNEIGNSFRANIVGVQFANNKTGCSIQNCHFGSQFYYNYLGNDILHVEINKNNVYYIKIEDGVEYVNITTSASGSGNLQNIIIGKGVKGESTSNPKVITHPTLNDTKQTTYLPTDSTTVNV